MSSKSSREAHITAFLKTNGFGAAKRESMGGDASFRHYERLTLGGKSYIMMDAPPPKEDVRPFLHIGKHLANLNLSAPKILAEDVEQGLLVLEDLGDARYSIVLSKQPELEETLYAHAIDVLVYLHDKKLPNPLPEYDVTTLIEHVHRFTEWYLPKVAHVEVTESLKNEFTALWEAVLPKRRSGPDVLALWDYHADNLMWLPEREGMHRVGLLDFQDAMSCPPAYDLVSLLQDCRRPISPNIESDMLKRYLSKVKLDKAEFERSYAIIGAQRHTRILGTFARLAHRDGKPHYLNWIPKEWDYLNQNLAHPALAELRAFFARVTAMNGVAA